MKVTSDKVVLREQTHALLQKNPKNQTPKTTTKLPISADFKVTYLILI